MRIVIDILICLSILFAFAGVVGMIRMPDSFMRMHSSTNITTFGVLGVLIGGILYSVIYLKDISMVIKLAALIVFYLVTSPIAAHAIGRAAYRSKTPKSPNTIVDKYGEDLEDE